MSMQIARRPWPQLKKLGTLWVVGLVEMLIGEKVALSIAFADR